MSEQTDMAEASMDLTVDRKGELIEIKVVGLAKDPLGVEYELVVEGASRTVHRGKSMLAGGQEKVLSTVKVSASDDFCASLRVTEAGGREYALHRGACA